MYPFVTNGLNSEEFIKKLDFISVKLTAEPGKYKQWKPFSLTSKHKFGIFTPRDKTVCHIREG